MTTDAQRLAERLLDAQVDFVLAELGGKRLAQLIARDVDDLLTLAAELTVNDLLDREQVKALGRRLLVRAGDTTLPDELVLLLADAIYDLPASDEHRLGDVVDRDPVSALISKVLSMQSMHDRAMERLAESPLVAVVATRFVTKIVSDFLEQNRKMAEKLPGAKSLISLGMGAASRVRSATVDTFLGDAAGKSTQYAIRRTNSAMRDMIRDAPLHGAAMEIWDLHADEPVGELREYLSQQDVRDLVVLLQEILAGAVSTEFAGALLEGCIDALFDGYGSRDVASLVADAGVTRDDLVDELRRFLPPVVDAARSTGRLDDLVRARLAPFYASKPVQAILSGADGEPKKAPAKKASPRPAKSAARTT